jgi:hypothetical protein
MIAKWLEMLAGFIVDKFCAKVGVENRADLESLIGGILKSELPDLGKFETMPEQIVAAVSGQIAAVIAPLVAIPAQVLAQLKNLIPAPFNVFGR